MIELSTLDAGQLRELVVSLMRVHQRNIGVLEARITGLEEENKHLKFVLGHQILGVMLSDTTQVISYDRSSTEEPEPQEPENEAVKKVSKKEFNA